MEPHSDDLLFERYCFETCFASFLLDSNKVDENAQKVNSFLLASNIAVHKAEECKNVPLQQLPTTSTTSSSELETVGFDVSCEDNRLHQLSEETDRNCKKGNDRQFVFTDCFLNEFVQTCRVSGENKISTERDSGNLSKKNTKNFQQPFSGNEKKVFFEKVDYDSVESQRFENGVIFGNFSKPGVYGIKRSNLSNSENSYYKNCSPNKFEIQQNTVQKKYVNSNIYNSNNKVISMEAQKNSLPENVSTFLESEEFLPDSLTTGVSCINYLPRDLQNNEKFSEFNDPNISSVPNFLNKNECDYKNDYNNNELTTLICEIMSHVSNEFDFDNYQKQSLLFSFLAGLFVSQNIDEESRNLQVDESANLSNENANLSNKNVVSFKQSFHSINHNMPLNVHCCPELLKDQYSLDTLQIQSNTKKTNETHSISKNQCINEPSIKTRFIQTNSNSVELNGNNEILLSSPSPVVVKPDEMKKTQEFRDCSTCSVSTFSSLLNALSPKITEQEIHSFSIGCGTPTFNDLVQVLVQYHQNSVRCKYSSVHSNFVNVRTALYSTPNHHVLAEYELSFFRVKLCHNLTKSETTQLCTDVDRCSNSHCITWQRRDPYAFRYKPVLCPDIEFLKKGNKMNLVRKCNRGRSCNFAHSKEEELYHPVMYKTKICKSFPKCHRFFCPFAHGTGDLRAPSKLVLVKLLWGSDISVPSNNSTKK